MEWYIALDAKEMKNHLKNFLSRKLFVIIGGKKNITRVGN